MNVHPNQNKNVVSVEKNVNVEPNYVKVNLLHNPSLSEENKPNKFLVGGIKIPQNIYESRLLEHNNNNNNNQ